MKKPRRLFTFLIHVTIALSVVLGSFYATAVIVRPPITPFPSRSLDEIRKVEALRDTTLNTASPPVVWRKVDYSEGTNASWHPKGEPDLITPLVLQGKLPPVTYRVGTEPLVLAGTDGIGRFGGTWFCLASSDSDVATVARHLGRPSLVRWSPEGYPVVPHIARSWTYSDDKTLWTFRLRRGMRWSDGHLFTARDIAFWWEDQVLFKTVPLFMLGTGTSGRVEITDDYTVRFIFNEPNPLFLEQLCRILPALPIHYLLQFHPIHGSEDAIEKMRVASNLGSARSVYDYVQSPRNRELPRLSPWIPYGQQKRPPYTFIRNPYYFAVDPEGNQLPYIDRIQVGVKPESLIGLSAAQGDLTFQLRHIRYQDYTSLMNQRGRYDYEVLHWFPASRSIFTIFPNTNRRVDELRPDTTWKRWLLNERNFRRALSLSINREEVIRAEYNNQVKPAQLEPGLGSRFHHRRLLESYVDYDPSEANHLLNGLGLKNRDRENMRTLPDGSRLTLYLHVTDYTGIGPSQLLIDHWAAVGVRVVLREQPRTLWTAQYTSLEHDLSVWSGESEFHPLLMPYSFVPTGPGCKFAPGFGRWYYAGGFFGSLDVNGREGVLVPPDGHIARHLMDLFTRAISTSRLTEQHGLVNQILDIAADEVWSISIGTPPPQLVIASNGLRNVPDNAITGMIFSTPTNAGVETFWLDKPSDAASAIDEMRMSLTSSPTSLDVPHEVSGVFKSFLRSLFVMIAIIAAILIAHRHPYIARRLALMVPTLLVVSVIVFTIVQLPPSDFLTSRIHALEMVGDTSSIHQAENLKKLFHYDEGPVWKYMRWIGVPWFFSFADRDLGLIQGHLGRSMENGRSVNEIVGDRVLITVIISLASITLTWVVALILGIYSAARRYSVGDYIITLFAYIGMCIPGFLLALILIHLSSEWFNINVSGLFSPEFASQAEWDIPKIKDFIQHVWVPVAVLIAVSTGAMLRVMRGNLLDELNKPYVIAARAKGVPPIRLLFKYPVRLALNPFISDIGNAFPALLSASSVVAIVLALPTVGPLMLSALMAEDLYLAGSMLMVLAALSVFGTLVSDLLLLALDPRIRFGGNKR